MYKQYILTKDERIIDLENYELDEETDDRYYFSDTKYHSAGIIVKKSDVVRYSYELH